MWLKSRLRIILTEAPSEYTALSTTAIAVQKALDDAGVTKEEIGVLEVHDCFSITATEKKYLMIDKAKTFLSVKL
jgi:3-oxoacyl-[acyl-carrier-protein] synthase III